MWKLRTFPILILCAVFQSWRLPKAMIDKRQRKCFARKRKTEALVTKEESANSPVKFLRLFRFASRNDTIFVSASVGASILNGICLPLMVLLWGDLSNVIIENYDSEANNTVSTNNTTTCQSYTNITKNTPMFTYISIIFYSATEHCNSRNLIFL